MVDMHQLTMAVTPRTTVTDMAIGEYIVRPMLTTVDLAITAVGIEAGGTTGKSSMLMTIID
jgi:hypothetical protein